VALGQVLRRHVLRRQALDGARHLLGAQSCAVDQESAAQEAARRKAEQAAVKRDKARASTKKVPTVKTKGESDDSWKSFDSFEDIFAYEVERTRS
jgi:hypothetical protein